MLSYHFHLRKQTLFAKDRVLVKEQDNQPFHAVPKRQLVIRFKACPHYGYDFPGSFLCTYQNNKYLYHMKGLLNIIIIIHIIHLHIVYLVSKPINTQQYLNNPQPIAMCEGVDVVLGVLFKCRFQLLQPKNKSNMTQLSSIECTS